MRKNHTCFIAAFFLFLCRFSAEDNPGIFRQLCIKESFTTAFLQEDMEKKLLEHRKRSLPVSEWLFRKDCMEDGCPSVRRNPGSKSAGLGSRNKRP